MIRKLTSKNWYFFRPAVKFAQYIMGTEFFFDADIIENYAGDNYSQGYTQIVSCSKHFTKDDIVPT